MRSNSRTFSTTKGTISEVRVHAGAKFGHTGCWSMQAQFTPEEHRWISKLTACHLLHQDKLITMVKETIILYKKEFRKMKKSETCFYLSLI